jgi:hypothetical protein
MNPLTGIHSVAVNDGVIDSFPKRQFDCWSLAGNAMRPFDQPHQPIHHGRDGLDLTRSCCTTMDKALK